MTSWNLNGIRAAAKNGFFNWLAAEKSEVVLLQEVRADESVILQNWRNISCYKSIWHAAEKKGYSGVGIYTKSEFSESDILRGLGSNKFDSEGRFLGVVINKIAYISAYFPNSQREGTRLSYKLDFCNELLKKLSDLQSQGIKIVLGGDFNIAHSEIDLANPKANQRNAGFLPEERAWMSTFLGEGYTDTFREFQKEGGHYSWWSNRPGVRERNIGWRLDYHCVSKDLKASLVSAQIHPQTLGSDHCPVSLEMDLK